MSVAVDGSTGWEARGIWKRFPGVMALRDASIVLLPGQVHALIGQNGGGKSTLVQMFSGALAPDAGFVRHNGRRVNLSTPLAARHQGVATIYQEFSLIPTLSVAENIGLGIQGTRRRMLVSWSELRKRAVAALRELDVEIDVDKPVGSLSKAEQQLVEIAKSLVAEPSLLILDEPTTALSLDEAARLHRLVRGVAETGRCVLYISHRLEELPGFVDAVTVLRDGVVVAELAGVDVRVDRLIRAMLGHDTQQTTSVAAGAQDGTALQLANVSADNGIRSVTLSLHRGEVVGLAGLTGSGRTEIVRAIIGADHITSGDVILGGKRVRFRSPRAAIRAGVGFVPENRKTEGLFFNFVGSANITIASLKALAEWGWLRLKRERTETQRLATRLGLTKNAVAQRPGVLSGGNQQKLVLGRWLLAGSRVLCLDEPTQGIDVGAKAEVYALIDELTRNGVAVLLISSEDAELLALCDRIAIVRDHTIVTVMPARDLDKFTLASLTAGVAPS